MNVNFNFNFENLIFNCSNFLLNNKKKYFDIKVDTPEKIYKLILNDMFFLIINLENNVCIKSSNIPLFNLTKKKIKNKTIKEIFSDEIGDFYQNFTDKIKSKKIPLNLTININNDNYELIGIPISSIEPSLIIFMQIKYSRIEKLIEYENSIDYTVNEQGIIVSVNNPDISNHIGKNLYEQIITNSFVQDLYKKLHFIVLNKDINYSIKFGYLCDTESTEIQMLMIFKKINTKDVKISSISLEEIDKKHESDYLRYPIYNSRIHDKNNFFLICTFCSRIYMENYNDIIAHNNLYIVPTGATSTIKDTYIDNFGFKGKQGISLSLYNNNNIWVTSKYWSIIKHEYSHIKSIEYSICDVCYTEWNNFLQKLIIL